MFKFVCLAVSIFMVVMASTIPDDWAQRVSQGHMMFSNPEPKDANFMPYVGNGYLATNINSDTIFVGGLFNGFGIDKSNPSHRARLPTTVRITVGGVDMVGGAMDFEHGVYYRRTSTKDGAAIEQRWYAHRVYRNILVHEISVEAGSKDLHASISNDAGPASTDVKLTQIASAPLQWTGMITATEEKDSQQVNVAIVSTPIPSNLEVPAGSTAFFSYITAIRTDISGDCTGQTPLQCATADYNSAATDAENLLSSHLKAWLMVWQGRIEISGRLELAQAVNASMYYILASVRDDWPFSTSPGSLASNSYNGHVFWDVETWMYPTTLMLHPSMAASMLQYRFNHMDGAAKKAQSYNMGYQGLMYPWESAFTGQEVCPTSAPTGQLEQHISGDISFAIMQYYRASGDVKWLSNVGAPMLKGIADFWKSSNPLVYEIKYVIPPDEYAVNVSNSVYTNVVAQMALNYAIECAPVAGYPVNPKWQEVSDSMYIPFDSATNIHPEFDGYHGQTIKQADVVLLGFPLMFPMSAAVREADLLYYEPRTDPNGPAMTWGMHAVAYLELNRSSDASALFNRSYANVQQPFDVWMETPKGGAINFITGAGGFLQGVLFGYGGLRLRDGQMEFFPQLFEGSDFVAFRSIGYQGSLLDVEYDSEHTLIRVTSLGGANLSAQLTDGTGPRCSLSEGVGASCLFPPVARITVYNA